MFQLRAYGMKISVVLPEVLCEVDRILAQRAERKGEGVGTGFVTSVNSKTRLLL